MLIVTLVESLFANLIDKVIIAAAEGFKGTDKNL